MWAAFGVGIQQFGLIFLTPFVISDLGRKVNFRLGLIRGCSQVCTYPHMYVHMNVHMYQPTHSQRPLHVQGDAGHPSLNGGGQEKNNRKNEGPRRRRGPPQKK
jgi:hypothetical protein